MAKKIILSLIVIWLMKFHEINAQESASNHLEMFSNLVGSTWVLDNAHQTFEWGVGQKSVISKSYTISNGNKTLSSEGMWFWHPGEKKVKGYFTAINMPFALLEYTTTFKKEEISSDITSYTSNGNAQKFHETIAFMSDSSYRWQLFQVSDEGRSQIMSGTFVKQ